SRGSHRYWLRSRARSRIFSSLSRRRGSESSKSLRRIFQLLQCLPCALTVGARDRCLRSRGRLYQGSGDVAGSDATALLRRSLEIREQLFLLVFVFVEGAL